MGADACQICSANPCSTDAACGSVISWLKRMTGSASVMTGCGPAPLCTAHNTVSVRPERLTDDATPFELTFLCRSLEVRLSPDPAPTVPAQYWVMRQGRRAEAKDQPLLGEWPSVRAKRTNSTSFFGMPRSYEPSAVLTLKRANFPAMGIFSPSPSNSQGVARAHAPAAPPHRPHQLQRDRHLVEVHQVDVAPVGHPGPHPHRIHQARRGIAGGAVGRAAHAYGEVPGGLPR